MKRSKLMRKVRIKAISDKGAERLAELDDIRPVVMARAHGFCEVCADHPVEHLHHKLRRSQGGANDLANLIGVCHNCHFKIHQYPAASYESGLLIRRNS